MKDKPLLRSITQKNISQNINMVHFSKYSTENKSLHRNTADSLRSYKVNSNLVDNIQSEQDLLTNLESHYMNYPVKSNSRLLTSHSTNRYSIRTRTAGNNGLHRIPDNIKYKPPEDLRLQFYSKVKLKPRLASTEKSVSKLRVTRSTTPIQNSVMNSIPTNFNPDLQVYNMRLFNERDSLTRDYNYLINKNMGRITTSSLRSTTEYPNRQYETEDNEEEQELLFNNMSITEKLNDYYINESGNRTPASFREVIQPLNLEIRVSSPRILNANFNNFRKMINLNSKPVNIYNLIQKQSDS